jgi:hypothetical protein
LAPAKAALQLVGGGVLAVDAVSVAGASIPEELLGQVSSPTVVNSHGKQWIVLSNSGAGSWEQLGRTPKPKPADQPKGSLSRAPQPAATVVLCARDDEAAAELAAAAEAATMVLTSRFVRPAAMQMHAAQSEVGLYNAASTRLFAGAGAGEHAVPHASRY